MEEVIAETNRRIDKLESRLKHNKIHFEEESCFVEQNVQVKEDFDQLYDSIKKMSQICIEKVDKMLDEYESIETDILGPASVVKAIKDTSGSRFLHDFAQKYSSKSSTESTESTLVLEPSHNETQIVWPGEGYEIDLEVEDKIGRQVEDEMSQAPLLIAIPPDKTRPEAWSRQEDYFRKIGSSGAMSSLKEMYYPDK